MFENRKFDYVPKDIRAGAIRDLCKAYKTSFTNLKKGNISKFSIGFRKKKQNQSLEIPKSAISYNNKKIKLFLYLNSITKTW